MKRKPEYLKDMIRSHSLNVLMAAGLILSSPGMIMAATSGNSDTTSSTDTIFTAEQEVRIGEVAKNYLLAHADLLMEMSQKLQEQQQAQQMKTMTEAVIANQISLLKDKLTPSYGPADARVTVVGFFDYQCVYCARLTSEQEKVMKANPDVRFVFKELPIFGERWPASKRAAETGLRIWQEKGAEAYLKYHNAIFATGHNEGKLTPSDINKAASAVNYVAKKNSADVQGPLENTFALAQKLGFSGTPALVVMPSTGADADNVTVIPGYTQAETLQTAIDKAASKAKSSEDPGA